MSHLLLFREGKSYVRGMLVNTNLGHQNLGHLPCPGYVECPGYHNKEVFKVSKISPVWEEFGYSPKLKRMPVWGGWIVESFAQGQSGDSVSICFVPDAGHKWEVK